MKYPKFIGKNSNKMRLFRLQKQFPIGDPRRYPIRLRLPVPVDVSFGVRTPTRKGALRINEDAAIKISANKLSTKRVLSEVGVRVLPHVLLVDLMDGGAFDLTLFEECGITYPLVIKNKGLSGGRDMHFIDDLSALSTFLGHLGAQIEELHPNNSVGKKNIVKKYYLEPRFDNRKEFRIHASPWLFGSLMNYHFNRNVRDGDGWRTALANFVNRYGIMLISRKMLTTEARDAGRFHRNIEPGQSFLKHLFTGESIPMDHEQFGEMCEDVLLAIKQVDLDFGFADVMVNSEGNWVISETGCNPGINIHEDRPNPSITFQAYQQALPRIIMEKAYNTKFYHPTKQVTVCADLPDTSEEGSNPISSN